jgi:hypothetical protein
MRTENLFSTMLKQSAILICFTFFSGVTFCQKEADFKFGNVSAKDFDVSSLKIVDSNTDAVVLYASGSTHFIGNNSGSFSYVYTCIRRIKIINKKAFDLATISLSLYTDNDKDDDDEDILSDIKATTYNLENGVVTSVPIDKRSIFSDKEDENHINKKFALPAVKEGCIIEYTYTLTSPDIFNMHSWKFQHKDYPVLWSEYQVCIPSVLTYTFIKQGIDSFYMHTYWEGKETYEIDKISGYPLFVKATTINHRWVEKDLKPLNAENYISSPDNYVDKIEFQLSGTYNGREKSDVLNTWKSVTEYFANKKDFVQAVEGDNSWIKDVPGTGSDELQTAKSIYYYVQNNYTCTDDEDIYSYTDLYEVYRKQKGTVREINLLLIAMLKNKGIYAEPVMLSTKSNGFVNPYYPVLDKFNYIICRSVINGKVYLLDATKPTLSFDQLSTECYNGYARIINTHHSDSLYLFSDSLVNSDVSTLSLSNDDDGKISGSYKRTMGKISSADMRKKMLTTNSSAYFKDIKNDYPFDVNMSNAAIDSLDEREMPVAVQYDIHFKLNDDIVYFNPIAPSDIEKENPFKAAQRSYPVEMDYCMDKTYVLNMQVPAGYAVDELPKSARISLNGNEGTFQYLIQHTGDNIQLMCRLKLNQATFEPEDYETLRNFYAAIVEKEGEQIVFKKQ